MEDNICKCRCTPSEVGEEFVSLEDEARTELSYASARGSKYVAPPIENPIHLPIPPPCHPCGWSLIAPALKEILRNLPELSVRIWMLCCKRWMRRGFEIFKKGLQTWWYTLHLKLAQISGGGSTESIVYVQGQAEGISRPHALVPIFKGIPQDVVSSFRVQESQGDEQALHLAPPWEIFFPMFPGELRCFLLSTLIEMDLQPREQNFSGHLVESWVSGFTINLKIELTDVEGEVLMEVMGVDEMERIHGGD